VASAGACLDNPAYGTYGTRAARVRASGAIGPCEAPAGNRPDVNDVLSNFDRHRADGSPTSLQRTGPLRPSSDCFADEVAIDFPSSGSVIDRLRASCAEYAEVRPLSAEVVLTPAQALYGVTLPLDVRLPCTCDTCGGRGEVWMEGCVTCLGTGVSLVAHQIQLTLPPRLAHGTRFRFSVSPATAPATLVEVHVAVV